MEIKTDVKKKRRKKEARMKRRKKVEDKHYWKRKFEMRVSVFFVALFVIL